MAKLPETMSLYEVERRVSRLRWRIILLVTVLAGAAFVSGGLSIWLRDLRWAETAVLCCLGAGASILAYLVVNTPAMVPRMAEHYRVRGVRFTDGEQ